jgi:hypothetical protein
LDKFEAFKGEELLFCLPLLLSFIFISISLARAVCAPASVGFERLLLVLDDELVLELVALLFAEAAFFMLIICAILLLIELCDCDCWWWFVIGMVFGRGVNTGGMGAVREEAVAVDGACCGVDAHTGTWPIMLPFASFRSFMASM